MNQVVRQLAERQAWWLGVVCGMWLCGPAASLQAGGGPANVAVVVNADSWSSQTIANHYVHLRGVPASNVVHLSGLDGFQSMDVEAFREQILMPVLKTLFERGILNQIDCVAYSADLPTAINTTGDLAGITPDKHVAPMGSINGLTYLYQLVLAKRPDYMQLGTNFYMRHPVEDSTAIPATAQDREAFDESQKLVASNKWDAAVQIMEPLAARLPQNASLQYNLACCLAQLGRTDAAIEALQRAVEAGWSERQHAEADKDLESLRGSPSFVALLGKMDNNRARTFDVQPTRAFHSVQRWDNRGEVVAEDGIQYMMSTVLAVTSGRGNSVREVLDSLQRNVAADATQPTGTIYFMENSDVRATTRQRPFLSVVKALEGTPVKGQIEQGTLPQGKQDVLGAMVGVANFNWSASKSTILPGAICEHLTSFGGAMQESAGQTPLSEFIRAGAAGTSGTVTEPYAIQAKFPYAFMHVHYARGCSLAEAFYQAVLGPYQLLIVGDPLCQPWARRCEVQVPQLQPNQRVSGTISLEPTITGVADPETVLNHFELFLDGKRGKVNPGLRSFKIDTSGLNDGWHELRVVAVAKGPIESQSQVVIPLVIDNSGKTVELGLDGTATAEVTYGSEFVLQAAAAGAAEIVVSHQARELGKIEGPGGTLTIDSRRLGLGPVQLQASAQLDRKTVLSAPLHVNIVAPPPLPPVKGVNTEQLAPGLAMTLDGSDAGVIEETKDAKWLAAKAKQAGQKLALDGYFTASSEDLYQFQFKGNAVSEILVDGQSLWKASESPRWTMIPVHLAKGLHRFQLTGTISETPTLEVRFGNAGCRLLDGKRFQHVNK